jgi:hypothetical protein
MTDAWLMEADCIHGNTWYECVLCEEDQYDPDLYAAALDALPLTDPDFDWP